MISINPIKIERSPVSKTPITILRKITVPSYSDEPGREPIVDGVVYIDDAPHDAFDLTVAWLKMSNDSFFSVYGFNWIPPYSYSEEVKKHL